MKWLVTFITVFAICWVPVYFACTKDTVFNPTDIVGVTISAYVCDTTDLDTALLLTGSLPDTVTSLSPYAGQTVTFLAFIKGDSAAIEDLTWHWDFGDDSTSCSRIVEHRYMTAGTYKAVFTITNSVGVSLSDTVIISTNGISPHAAVRGFAFFQGKSKHDGIEIIIKSEGGTEYKMTSAESGLFQKMSNVPYGTYTVYYTDKKTGWFSPDSIEDFVVKDAILNELGKVTLKDNYNPHINDCYPTGTIDTRLPIIGAKLVDTASGIALESFLLVFNGDTIPDSLITLDDTSFFWKPLSRLPDKNFSVFTSAKDSAGNNVDKTWSFDVDAMKLTVMKDTIFPMNVKVDLYGKVSDVFSNVVQYKWDFDGDGKWDDSVVTIDTVVARPWIYKHEGVYKAVLCARDDSGTVKLDTASITVGKALPCIDSIRFDTTISINDSISFYGNAHDPDGTIKEYAWDFNGDGTYEYTSGVQINTGHMFTTAGIYVATLRVTDDEDQTTKDSTVIEVLQDMPILNAGNDTAVSINGLIPLHGNAKDSFGVIVKWEWDFGNTGAFKLTSTSDTSISAPASQHFNYQCILKVTDDDGNVALDTVIIFVCFDFITDIDGNVYKTIKIGNQEWMAENLRTTKYNDGTELPLVTEDHEWFDLATPAYCYYNNTTNADSIKKYGALYNWHALNTTNFFPQGWHVPSDADWDTLVTYLITNGYNWDGTTSENKIAKSLAVKSGWKVSTQPGTIGNNMHLNNRSGFSAIPGGFRNTDGTFGYIIINGGWWSASEWDPLNENYRDLNYDSDYLNMNVCGKSCGLSARLVKD